MNEPASHSPPLAEWPSQRARWTRFASTLAGMFLLMKVLGYLLWREPFDSHIAPTLLGSLLFSWWFSLRVPARRL